MNEHASDRRSFEIRRNARGSAGGCQMIDDSIEEYALRILDSETRRSIDRHLEYCPVCAARVASYRETVALLAISVPLAAPPAAAKSALMARIATLPRQATPTPSVFAGNLDTLRTPSLPSPAPAPSRPAPDNEPSSAWWRVYAAPLATLPLLLALGLVAAWGVNNYSQLHDSRDALAQRDMQIARLSSQLSHDNSQGVANLLVSPSAKRYALTSQTADTADAASGTLIADTQSGQAVVQVSGLVPGTYTVVVQMQNGQLAPKAEFEVGTQGAATTLVDLGTQVSDIDAVHIRPTVSTTETDVAAIASQGDVLMTTIGPNISDDSDTSVQKP